MEGRDRSQGEWRELRCLLATQRPAWHTATPSSLLPSVEENLETKLRMWLGVNSRTLKGVGRKHLKTFSCEEERDRAKDRKKKCAVAGRGFYGNIGGGGGGGGCFSNRMGLKMLQQQRLMEGMFLTKVPVSKFPLSTLSCG